MRRTSLAPAGFLISRIETGLPSTGDRLDPPEGRLDRGQRADRGLGVDPEAQRGGERGERVVDVVEPGQRQLELELAGRRDDPRARPAHAEQLDLGRRDLGRRPVGAAVGAAVVAEVADEGALVGVRVPAAPAVLGVVGVLELGQGLRRVLDPEEGDALAPAQLRVAAEVGDQRIVGVEDEAAAAGEALDHRAPFGRQVLELAVAVELVAEQVPEHDQARVELGGHPRQPGLVDLEQALGAALLEQRRGHAPAHVRSGPVVDRVAAVGAHRRREHPGGGRLPVGGADDRRPVDQARAEARDRVRRQPQQQPAGQGGAAAAPAAAAERSGRPRDPELRPEAGPSGRRGGHPGTITRSARGSTRTVAGRSARCSPSA